MTTPEIGIHQGDDGSGNFQSLPSSHEGEIDSNEEERSVEPQAEEDARNSGGLRNREMKSSRPEEDVRCPSELGSGKEKSSRSGKELDGGVTPDLPPINFIKVFVYGFGEMLAAVSLCNCIHGVLAVLLFLCSRSFSGELYVNQHEESKDLHQKISEMRIAETPLHSVRSDAQEGTRAFKLARHDFLLLRTAGDKWYKAEKHEPSSTGQAGIHFYPVPGPGAETIRFRSSISVDFSLALACFNLLDHDPDYRVWEENDWKYAHNSRAEAILNSCIEVASGDNELRRVFENLMDARRRMPNEGVDIVQPWHILWGVLSCFTAVFGCFWFGFSMDLDRRNSLLYEKVNNYSLLIVLFSILRPNPILWTYNLEWLGTTYYWHFHWLSFFGYYVGWTVFLRGVESWILELEKHSEDPCLRTAVSGREDLDTTILRTNYHQDDSMEDQRKKRPSRTVVFGLLTLIFVTTFEQALGYSIVNVFFRCWYIWGWQLAAKGDFSIADLREMMRYFSPSTYFSY